VAVIIVAVETVYFTVVIVMIVKVFDCEARVFEKVTAPANRGLQPAKRRFAAIQKEALKPPQRGRHLVAQTVRSGYAKKKSFRTAVGPRGAERCWS